MSSSLDLEPRKGVGTEFGALWALWADGELEWRIEPLDARFREYLGKRGALRTSNRAGVPIRQIATKAEGYTDDARTQPAIAHDFRRAFGTRWAKRVMPAVLQRLMRHKDITEWYTWWLNRSEPLPALIEGFEAAGYKVARAGQLRTACVHVALLPLDFDRVARNVEDLEAGNGVPFDQAMNELQNQPR